MAGVYSNIILQEGQKHEINLHIDYTYLENLDKLKEASIQRGDNQNIRKKGHQGTKLLTLAQGQTQQKMQSSISQKDKEIETLKEMNKSL